jgi:hypothetical protein
LSRPIKNEEEEEASTQINKDALKVFFLISLSKQTFAKKTLIQIIYFIFNYKLGECNKRTKDRKKNISNLLARKNFFYQNF